MCPAVLLRVLNAGQKGARTLSHAVPEVSEGCYVIALERKL